MSYKRVCTDPMDVLQNDLVRKCLLGVPYKSHDNLKAVCRERKAIVNNPKFYLDRKITGASEQLIYLKDQMASIPSMGLLCNNGL